MLIALVLMLGGIAFRLLPHDPNFAPVGAIALFGGAILAWRTALWLPLLIMIISDLVIGFYNGIEFTWLAFVLVAVFGLLFRRSPLTIRVSVGALGGGLLFFVVSNFGVWLTSGMYVHSFEGLVQCYYAALPFLRNTLMGDVVFGVVLFGAYELARHFVAPRLADVRLPYVAIK